MTLRGLIFGIFVWDFSFGVDGLVSHLQQLFRGHPNLIRTFNAYLPRGYQLRDN
jgi:histone deacetylase complex regulatory component SIN3